MTTSAVTEAPAARVGRHPSRYTPWAVILLAPAVVVLALRLPLINQLNFADAWFYTSYALMPKHDFAFFGYTYFGVRFPAIILIGGFQRIFGTVIGYVLLRYLLAVLTGAALYVFARRFTSVAVAVAAVILLYLDPFFSRLLLWDYAAFVEVTGGVAGIALWLWAGDRRPRWTAPAGVALSAAVFANELILTGLLVLFVVEAVAAVRQGSAGLRRFVTRLGVAALSGLAVFAIGYLVYATVLGFFNPFDLIRPVVHFFANNSQESAIYQRPVSTWILREPRIWGPVVLSLALVATMRRRLLGTDLPARAAQFAVGYTAFLWLFRFTIVSSDIETWYAYDVVVIALAPGVAVVLSELAGSRSRSLSRVALIACIAFAIWATVLRDVPSPIATMYHEIQYHSGLDLLVLVVGVVAALLCAVRRVRAPAGVLLSAVLAVTMFAPSLLDGRGTTGLFVTSGAQELHAYQSAPTFVNLIRDYDRVNARLFLWYNGLVGDVNLAWTDLPQTGNTINEVGVDQPITRLQPLGVARLNTVPVKYVLILTPHPRQIRLAIHSLAAQHFYGRVVRSGHLGRTSLNYAVFEFARITHIQG